MQWGKTIVHDTTSKKEEQLNLIQGFEKDFPEQVGKAEYEVWRGVNSPQKEMKKLPS